MLLEAQTWKFKELKQYQTKGFKLLENIKIKEISLNKRSEICVRLCQEYFSLLKNKNPEIILNKSSYLNNFKSF
jgi:hypothetical protein